MTAWRDTGLSKSAYYRRRARAMDLGCLLEGVPCLRGRHGNHVRGEQHPRYGLGVPRKRSGGGGHG